MDRKHAEVLARTYSEFGDWFNRTTLLSMSMSMSMSDAEQAKKVRRCLVDMLYLLDEAVRLPVSREYPDLFPDDEQ